jgi:hypothetical protein
MSHLTRQFFFYTYHKHSFGETLRMHIDYGDIHANIFFIQIETYSFKEGSICTWETI